MKNYTGFIYCTTNLLNNKKYIGQCSGDLDDYRVKSYLGSGKALLRAIKKNGKENFVREILAFAYSQEDLNKLERKFILEYGAVLSTNYYNIAPGGKASLGFTGKKHTAERNKALSAKMKSKEFIHPMAKSFFIDDIQYRSITEARNKAPYPMNQIIRFLKTGIHPNDQIKKRYTRGPKKLKMTHFFIRTDNSILAVQNLSVYCANLKIGPARLLATKNKNIFVNGLKFSHKLLMPRMSDTPL